MTNRCLALLALPVALAACDPNGFPHFNEPLDLTGDCDALSTVWIRHVPETEPPSTEVLIVGSALDGIDTQRAGCFYRANMTRDGDIYLDQGTFAFDGEDGYDGTITTSFTYTFEYEPEVGVLSRAGAYRTEVDPPREEAASFNRGGNDLSATVGEASHDYAMLMPLIASLDLDVPEQLYFAGRLFNVGLLLSQTRVLGFGGAGMSQFSTPATFDGLVTGDLTMTVEIGLETNATVMYSNFSDIPGFWMDGPQLVATDLSGTGTMTGVVEIEFSNDTLSPLFLDGEVDFSNVTVKDGFGDGGHLLLRTGGKSYEIPAEQYLKVDFEGLE